jgi:hypothetical protein
VKPLPGPSESTPLGPERALGLLELLPRHDSEYANDECANEVRLGATTLPLCAPNAGSVRALVLVRCAMRCRSVLRRRTGRAHDRRCVANLNRATATRHATTDKNTVIEQSWATFARLERLDPHALRPHRAPRVSRRRHPHPGWNGLPSDVVAVGRPAGVVRSASADDLRRLAALRDGDLSVPPPTAITFERSQERTVMGQLYAYRGIAMTPGAPSLQPWYLTAIRE